MSLCFLWVCHSLRQIVHCFTRSWLIQLEKKKEQVKRSGAVTEAGRGIRPYIVWRSSLTSTDFTESFTAWAKHGTRLNTVSFFISSCKIIFIVSSSCLKLFKHDKLKWFKCGYGMEKRAMSELCMALGGITNTWCSHVIWLCQVSKKEALLLKMKYHKN